MEGAKKSRKKRPGYRGPLVAPSRSAVLNPSRKGPRGKFRRMSCSPIPQRATKSRARTGSGKTSPSYYKRKSKFSGSMNGGRERRAQIILVGKSYIRGDEAGMRKGNRGRGVRHGEQNRRNVRGEVSLSTASTERETKQQDWGARRRAVISKSLNL